MARGKKRRRKKSSTEEHDKDLEEIWTAVIDLHGRSWAEARQEVRNFLMTQQRARRGHIVKIITGKGLRSEGAPVLATRLPAFLENELAPFVKKVEPEPGGGGYLVWLK